MKTDNPKLKTCDMLQKKTIDLKFNINSVTRNWTELKVVSAIF